MFESLIKSILDKVAGEYIQGLNTDNLSIGIFSGDVKIENVSLNPSVIDLLELPLTLRFSKIEKLELKVPFKNLGSKPVEVFLDGLYVILNPKAQSEWSFKDYRELKAKLGSIEAFAAECLQKIAAKQQEKSKVENDAGYMQKLTMKIVDNLQITIKNIHVRFEDTISNVYSWGFCLDTIEIYTTNQTGLKTFVDRTDVANKNEPMRKLLTISNVGLYWTANEERMISIMADENKIKILNGMIQRQGEATTKEPVEFLFKLSLQVSLMMNNKGNFTVPEIKVNLSLEHITLHLQQRQLQQVIEQIEFISKFQTELSLRKKNDKKIDPLEIERLANVFQVSFLKMMSQEKDKSVACLEPKQREEFEKAVCVLDIEILQDRTKKVVLDVQKALKIKELEKKKQDEKKGFFGKWFKSNDQESSSELVTADDKAQIEQFINANFGAEVIDAPMIVRPEDYVYMILEFDLAGASIKLSNRSGQEVQCLQFSLKHIYGSVYLRDNNNEVKLKLDSIELSMIDEFLANKTSKEINVLRPTHSGSALMEFSMVSNPLDKKHINKVIDLKMRSVRFDYNPFLAVRAVQFFDVKVKDDQLKQQAKDKIAEKIEEKQTSIQEAMKNPNVMALNVHLESPVIVLPFKTDGSLTNECWVLNLGNLAVKTVESQLQPDLPFEQKALDMYDISLEKIKLSYFPSIEYYNQYIIADSADLASLRESKIVQLYHTIEEFSINVGIAMVKGPAQGKINKPNISVKGAIDQINLKLKPSIYKKLLEMGQCFAIPEEEVKQNKTQILEEVELEKKNLLKNSQKSAVIFKRGNAIKTWVKYNAVLSNGYVYLFDSPKDLKPVEYFWVKNSVITKLDEKLVGFQNAFNVKNRYTDVYLACEKEKASQQWIEALDQVRTVQDIALNDFDLEDLIAEQDQLENGSLEKKKSEKSKSSGSNFDLVLLEATFELGQVKLSLFDDKKFEQKPFLTFQTNKLNAFYQKKDMKMSVNIGLGGMFLSDYLYKYKDSLLDDFITSKSTTDASSEELIKLGVTILEKGHPEYQNVGLDVSVNFNTLTINFKPETLAKVLLFIRVQEEDPQAGPTSELLRQFDNEGSTSAGSSSGQGIDSQASLSDADSNSQSGKSIQNPLALQDTDSILLQAKVSIKEIKVVLINRRNKLPVNDISISNIDLKFQQKSDEKFLQGTLGNLQVRDLTNFPNTIYKEEDWEKIVPQELIGLLHTENASSLMQIEFRSLSEGSAKIKADNIATFLKANMNSIHINYIQRPILRLLDYSLVQLLGPLGTPQYFLDEKEVDAEKLIQLQKEQVQLKDPMEPLKKLGKRQVRGILDNPKGMKMDIVMMNPLITLKPRPESTEYLQIDLGKITVSNGRIKSSERLLECKVQDEVKEVYSDHFYVKLANMQMRIVKDKNTVVEMTKAFDCNVDINMASFVNEFKYIYGYDIRIDTRMILKNYISPIIFRMSNADYNLCMSCLFKNITYDDGCDRFLIHDWANNQEAYYVIQKAKLEEAERLKKAALVNFPLKSGDQDSKGGSVNTQLQQLDEYDKEKGGMFVQLDMESMSIFAVEKESQLPFARVTLGKVRVIQQNTEVKMSTSLYAQTLNGSFFKKKDDGYQEGCLLGDLNIQRKYTKEQMSNLTFLVDHSLFKGTVEAFSSKTQNSFIQKLMKPKYEFTNYENTAIAKETLKFQIIFELQMMPNRDKYMDIIVADFKVQAETGPLMALSGFAIMDNTVQPPPPVYEVILTKEEIQAKQRAEQEIQQFKKQVGGDMKMNINVMNVLICTPCSDSTNVLAIRGLFDIQIHFQVGQSIPYIIEQINLKKTTLQECYSLNQTSLMAVELKGLEIFICNVEELKTKDFKKVNKRPILLPLDLSFSKKGYLMLASETATLFSNKTLMEVKLAKTSFKITFSDLSLIGSTVNLLLEDMKNPNSAAPQQTQKPEIKEEAKLTEEEKIQRELDSQDEKVVALIQNEGQINQMDLKAELQGFQIVIVNDMNAAYVPVLNFNIFEMTVNFKQNNIQLNVATGIQFSAEYYNPRVGLWEPIIEKVGFQIDFIKSELNNIKQLITVEMNSSYQNFNLTFSTQFLSILTKTTKTVKKEILPLAQKGKTVSHDIDEEHKALENSFEAESFQHVSPYTIKNETGYPIEVITDLTNVIQATERSSLKEAINQQEYRIQLKNNEEKNFQVDSDQSELGKIQGEETHVFKRQSEQVKVRVLIPGQPLDFIPQVDLDKVRSRLRACKSQATNKKVFELATEVKLDEVSAKKVLMISSPFYFTNSCQKTVVITLFDTQKAEKQAIKLHTNEKTAIPLDLVRGCFTVTIEGDAKGSDRLSFKKLYENFMNKAEEMKIDQHYIILKVTRDPTNTNRTFFSIEPPYKLTNCLPKTLFIQLINYKKFTAVTEQISSGESFEFYNCTTRKDAFLKIQIPGHYWSNEAVISEKTIEKLIIKDINGNQSEISVQQKASISQDNSSGCRQFFIYCMGYIINESPYKLSVFTGNKKDSKLVGGQKQIYQDETLNTNIVLLGTDSGDMLSLADTNYNKISKQTSIGGVGNTQVDLYTNNHLGNPVYQTMGINVSIKNVEQHEKLFSKVITITPRFIIVNKTGISLEVKQKGFDDKITEIDVDARIPLYWYDDNDSRFLNVRLVDQEKDWGWSGNLNVLELGTVNFLCRNKNEKMDLLFMRTDVRSDDSNIFIVIEKLTPKERPFLVQNLSKKVKLQLDDLFVTLQNAPEGQVNFNRSLTGNNIPNRLSVANNSSKEEEQKLPADQEYYFSWDQPFDKERKVVSHITPLNGVFKNISFIFSPDQIYFQDKIELPSLDDKKKESSLYLKWSIDIDGFTRIIRFEDSSFSEPVTEKEKKELRKKIQKEQDKKRKENEKLLKEREKSIQKGQKESKEITIHEIKEESVDIEEKPIIQQQISVLIKDFGVSVVQNNRMNEKPKEFLYLTIKGLEFIMITKEESKTTQARIKLMNIDQNSSYSLANPVIFTPQKFAQYSKPDSENFFINLVIEQNLLAKNITLYNNLAIEIDPFALRIEDQFINTLMDFLKAVEEAKFDADAQALNTLKDYLNESEQIQKTAKSKFKWQESEIPPTSLPTFINQLILSNIDLALTFKSKAKASDNDLNVLKSVFTALGVVLADIDAPIKLKGIKLTNCFESVQGIVSKLTTHFKDQAIREVLKVFGSLNIIGNPVGLFSNISTGVVDLIQKPAEGFVKGPLEGGLGIMQGASSLIKNTMAGAFNSVNKITGSLSSGISSLCMDEEYLEQREKMRQKKPKHIGEGAVQGVTSIFSGVANGITGVFLQPFQGAKKEGAKGFFKGLGKGIVGLVVKPVSGVLDAASLAAEGIKNTITYGDDKANEQRLRYPRVFYGREGFYKEFIDLDAGMKVAMQLVSKGKFSDSDFLQTFLIESSSTKGKKNLVLVLTCEVIMLFEQAKEKKQWYIPTSQLTQVQFKENGVNFTASEIIKQVKDKEVFIQVPLIEQSQYILDQINTLRFQLEEEKKIELLDN